MNELNYDFLEEAVNALDKIQSKAGKNRADEAYKIIQAAKMALSEIHSGKIEIMQLWLDDLAQFGKESK